MTNPAFQTLLETADAFARQGDWRSTLEQLHRAAELEPEHPGTLTGLGTCLIQLGRPSDAIAHFEHVVALAPESPEAHNNLGVVYALNGQLQAAESAYQAAIRQDGEHAPAWKNLAMVYLRQERLVEGLQILAALVKSNPQDVEALFLLGSCYEQGEDYASARLLYQQILDQQPDHMDAQQALARLPQPVPDLSRIARSEHVRKLASLKGLKKDGPLSQPRQRNGGSSPPTHLPVRVAFFGPAEPATQERLAIPAQALQASGAQVKVSTRLEAADLSTYDTFVFANPHAADGLLLAIQQCAQAGKRVVIDLDMSFHHLPAGHPHYARRGPGNSQALQALERAMQQADLLTVPSQVLAERYGTLARRVEVIPYAWDSSNGLWSKPGPRRETFNIGLVGKHTSPKDLDVLKKDLARWLRQTPQALLVIAEDFDLYQVFDSLPDSRRLFIPPGRVEDYPFLLAHFDLLLVPLRDDAFNQARSDLPLMEAGARGLPWIATPAPAFREWGAGGLFAERSRDWYSALKQLAGNARLREELGEAGRRKAEGRESKMISSTWI